ncbi:MAG: hypothetical protein H7A23_23620 [Leptospiraceae bacterium]|nr:hypothetical protein [Leptospiraceae bacterium]MCP5497553.1 hypothetical protein [Leptospiraceae bacterium]
MKPHFCLYAANLKSEDCIQSANLFSELFQLKIVKARKEHSELLTEDGLYLIFSKPSKHCKIEPGSITFLLNGIELESLQLSSLMLESCDFERGYSSYLDNYQNRIWILKKTS